jgi:hypothetical protein
LGQTAPPGTARDCGDIFDGFDAEYYLGHNLDVAAAGVDPLEHFRTFWREGLNPNAFFDTPGHLTHFADVAAAGVDPLQHYGEAGWKEGRDPSTRFDTQGYLVARPDVSAAHVNPLDHFLNYGVHENRAPINEGPLALTAPLGWYRHRQFIGRRTVLGSNRRGRRPCDSNVSAWRRHCSADPEAARRRARLATGAGLPPRRA